MKRFRERTQSLYWRQLFVTAGMVLLTLCLLGASFFSLSYNYARMLVLAISPLYSTVTVDPVTLRPEAVPV